jgi:hypothetical protein
MKGPLLFVVGGLAVGVAFFAGRMTGGDGDGGSATTTDAEDAERFERRVEELTKQLAAERARRAASEPAAGRARAARGGAAGAAEAGADGESGAASPGATAAASAPSGGAAVPATFTLEGVTSADEGSKRFMAFADAQLARGPEGYDAILDAMGTIYEERKAVEALFGDEATATRHLYPWIRFLVEREQPIVDLSEHLFRRMAEQPESFAELPSGKVLEPFSEGVGILLPGVVDEARLATFRGYAEKFLATPADQQPAALQNVRSDVERLLARFWAVPVSAEDALAKLKAGGVPARDIGRLVRAVPKDALATLDLTALVEPLLREGNQDVYGVLRSVPADRLDAARCDTAILAGLEAGRVQSHFIGTTLQQLGRRQWSDARSLFDRALGASETARNAAAEALVHYMGGSLRPDKAYVEDLLARGTLPERTAAMLRTTYGIK